jgi:hypothetical protein
MGGEAGAVHQLFLLRLSGKTRGILSMHGKVEVWSSVAGPSDLCSQLIQSSPCQQHIAIYEDFRGRLMDLSSCVGFFVIGTRLVDLEVAT